MRQIFPLCIRFCSPTICQCYKGRRWQLCVNSGHVDIVEGSSQRASRVEEVHPSFAISSNVQFRSFASFESPFCTIATSFPCIVRFRISSHRLFIRSWNSHPSNRIVRIHIVRPLSYGNRTTSIEEVFSWRVFPPQNLCPTHPPFRTLYDIPNSLRLH